MAHAFAIDTLAFSKKLRAAGADEQLAEAIVEGITGADTSSLATKEDLAVLRQELKEDIASVRQEIGDVKVDVATLRADVIEAINKGNNRILYIAGAVLGLWIAFERVFPLFTGQT